MFATATLALDAGILDRLIAILTTFAMGVGSIAKHAAPRPGATLAERAAPVLFGRLATAIAALTRIAVIGLGPARKPTPPKPAPAGSAPSLAPSPASSRAPALPRRTGWLLDALPDTAPALAADLAPLLATPALSTLLDARPALSRKLRPLLNALGLTLPPPATAQRPRPRPAAPAPTPEPAAPPPFLNRHARRLARRLERKARP